MADITVTAAAVAPVFPNDAEIHTLIAGEAIMAGQAVIIDTTTGRAMLASAAVDGTAGARAIALTGGAAGQAISALKKGHCAGFSLDALGYDAQVFLSDTEGAVADAAGTVSTPMGRVAALPDGTKCVYFDIRWA